MGFFSIEQIVTITFVVALILGICKLVIRQQRMYIDGVDLESEQKLSLGKIIRVDIT